MTPAEWYVESAVPMPGVVAWCGDETTLASFAVALLTLRLYPMDSRGARIPGSSWLDSCAEIGIADETGYFQRQEQVHELVGIYADSVTHDEVCEDYRARLAERVT